MITLANNILSTVASKHALALRHRPGCVSVLDTVCLGLETMLVNKDSPSVLGTFFLELCLTQGTFQVM